MTSCPNDPWCSSFVFLEEGSSPRVRCKEIDGAKRRSMVIIRSFPALVGI